MKVSAQLCTHVDCLCTNTRTLSYAQEALTTRAQNKKAICCILTKVTVAATGKKNTKIKNESREKVVQNKMYALTLNSTYLWKIFEFKSIKIFAY